MPLLLVTRNCYFLAGVMVGDEILSANDVAVNEVDNPVEDLRKALQG